MDNEWLKVGQLVVIGGCEEAYDGQYGVIVKVSRTERNQYYVHLFSCGFALCFERADLTLAGQQIAGSMWREGVSAEAAALDAARLDYRSTQVRLENEMRAKLGKLSAHTDKVEKALQNQLRGYFNALVEQGALPADTPAAEIYK